MGRQGEVEVRTLRMEAMVLSRREGGAKGRDWLRGGRAAWPHPCGREVEEAAEFTETGC